SQAYHMRWFLQNQTGDVQIENISDTVNGFQLAGPNAAKVLQAVTRSDVSAMKFMDVREMAVGMVNCVVQRVSYTGDLGFEIYCHTMDQRSLWQALWSAGQARFISWKKDADFIGKSAAIAEREAGSVRALVAFEVEAEDADVVAYEPVWIDGLVKGFCTSGGYSHYADKSIALALVPREHAVDGQEAEIEILGQMRRARVITTPLFDADGARMRG
ncbi:MAG: aminomethyl transferase family protein, partial [Rhodobacteraceae bacterium]|nr:aminomethyl transferase family protein [Paracoccaceae bacterium]